MIDQSSPADSVLEFHPLTRERWSDFEELSVFEKAGFVECARPSQSKVVMRHYIEKREAVVK